MLIGQVIGTNRQGVRLMSSFQGRSRTVTVRRRPRISVNKLGEYLVAGAARRRQILRDQKRPPEFQVIRYTEALRAIVEHLANRHQDPDVLARHSSRLANWSRGPGDSDYEAQRIQGCRDAIAAFAVHANLLTLDGLTVVPVRSACPKLIKAGVEISVQPDALVYGQNRGGRFVGALKLHLSKSNTLSQVAGEYVATMLHEFVEINYSDQLPCSYRHCLVFDVFGGTLISAPRSFTRRRSDVDAGCGEIAVLWDSV